MYPARLFDYPGPAELKEELSQEKARRQACLWYGGEHLLAYAYVDPFHNLRFDLHSAYVDELGPQVVAWGVDCLRLEYERDPSTTLDTSCAAENTERIAFLQRHGFDELPERTLKLSHSLLDLPLSDPVFPLGFTIRATLGPAEAVGTHPRYQGLGLATALLLYGMSLFKARGIEVARLATSSGNKSMQRAAHKAGFGVEAENVWNISIKTRSPSSRIW